MSTMTALYEYDFYAWLLKQAEFIRQGRLAELDRDHLAEELEAMSRSEKRELINRLAVLLEHFRTYADPPQSPRERGEVRRRAYRLFPPACGGIKGGGA